MIAVNIEPLLGMKYHVDGGPHRGYSDPDQLPPMGVNCQFTVLWALRRAGVELPAAWHSDLSRRIYEDRGIFQSVDVAGPFEMGDVFFFGYLVVPPSKYHLAIHMGNDPETNEDRIGHASVDAGVCIWPLSEFSLHRRYEKRYAVRRVNLSMSLQPMSVR